MSVSARIISSIILMHIVVLHVNAETYVVNSAQEIESRITQLQGGDSLLIENGEYDIGAIWLSNINGSEQNWIVIKGINGIPKIIGSKYENVINIDGCSYMKFEQLEITIDGQFDGIDGVTFRSSSHHIEFIKCRIINVTNVGINSQVREIHHIAVRDCEIAYCSTVGIYLGYNDPLRVARDCIIENSYIHHCPTDLTQETGYGMQIKGGSYRNIVRDNVLHDVGGTTRAGIAVYYTNLEGGWSVEDNNLVQGNIVWNATAEGIYAAAGATIENNLVYNARWGLEIYPYNGSVTENIILRNNTVYNCRDEGIYISGWQNTGDDCVVVNNLSIMENLSIPALISNNTGNSIIANNYYYGSKSGFNEGANACTPADQEFAVAGAGIGIPGLDLYPKTGSSIINAGTAAYGVPDFDFNHKSRIVSDAIDIGAYEYSTENNPGWQLSEDFKEFSGITSVGAMATRLPDNKQLLMNYPNPFNPSTTVYFQVKHHAQVNLAVFDLLGQRIETIIDRQLNAGGYQYQFDGTDKPSGVYILRLQISDGISPTATFSRRMILLR